MDRRKFAKVLGLFGLAGGAAKASSPPPPTPAFDPTGRVREYRRRYRVRDAATAAEALAVPALPRPYSSYRRPAGIEGPEEHDAAALLVERRVQPVVGRAGEWEVLDVYRTSHPSGSDWGSLTVTVPPCL